jgi:5'-nucleotidase
MKRILCTNDDGIHARGLDLSVEVCSGAGQVFVVAPDREQSGASHSLTLHRPLRGMPRGVNRWAVDGTPTDCAMLAIEEILPEKPDIVISGVNHGPNMGEDVLYSGTVAAAMEAVSLFVPAVALSFAGPDLDLLPTWKAPLERLIKSILASPPLPTPMFLNVNLPPIPGEVVKGVRITTLGSRVYEGSIKKMKDPWGRDIFWIGGGHINWKGGGITDVQAVADGYVSVTPLQLDITHHESLDAVRALKLEI